MTGPLAVELTEDQVEAVIWAIIRTDGPHDWSLTRYVDAVGGAIEALNAALRDWRIGRSPAIEGSDAREGGE